MKSAIIASALLATTQAQDWGTVGTWQVISPAAGSTPYQPYHHPTAFAGSFFTQGNFGDGKNYSFQYEVLSNTFVNSAPVPLTGQHPFMFSMGGSLCVIDEMDASEYQCIDSSELRTAAWSTTNLQGSTTLGRLGSRFASWGSWLFVSSGASIATTGSPVLHNDLWVLDFMSPSPVWTQVYGDNVPGLPSGRASHSFTPFGSHLVLFGGVTSCPFPSYVQCLTNPTACSYANDIWTWNPGYGVTTTYNAQQWQQISAQGTLPTPRYSHSAAAIGDQLYIFGGATANGFVSDFWTFNLVSQQWAQIQQTAPWPVSSYSTATALGHRFYALIANAGTQSTSLWVWTPSMSGPSQLPPACHFNNAARHGTTAGLVLAILLILANFAGMIVVFKKTLQ